jgi:signal transduction histidine kinase
MIEKDSQTDVRTLLPLTMGLWLGYLLALLLIDHLLYLRPVFPPVYYLTNGVIALLVLGLSRWPRARAWLGRAFLPLAIGLLSAVPVIMAQVVVTGQPQPNPASGPEAVLLRTMPLLLMALILTAWQYGWRYVILFSGGIALFTVGLHLFFLPPGGRSLLPPLTVMVIQTVSFLVVGYFISRLISQLKQQQASLARANRHLADYAATQEELAVSRERNRIARELHDTLAHSLSALSVQLETAKAYWEIDPVAARQMLDKSLAATRSGLQETRRALKALRASSLDGLGLSLALRQMATETAARANLQLKLSVPEYLPTLSPAVEQCIYRIAQEAIANVAHHANAHRLTVELSCNGDLLLQISDDGRGFNPQQVEPAGHFGLAGMRERAQLVSGALSITSQPGQGTIVQLRIEVS